MLCQKGGSHLFDFCIILVLSTQCDYRKLITVIAGLVYSTCLGDRDMTTGRTTDDRQTDVDNQCTYCC